MAPSSARNSRHRLGCMSRGCRTDDLNPPVRRAPRGSAARRCPAELRRTTRRSPRRRAPEMRPAMTRDRGRSHTHPLPGHWHRDIAATSPPFLPASRLGAGTSRRRKSQRLPSSEPGRPRAGDRARTVAAVAARRAVRLACGVMVRLVLGGHGPPNSALGADGVEGDRVRGGAGVALVPCSKENSEAAGALEAGGGAVAAPARRGRRPTAALATGGLATADRRRRPSPAPAAAGPACGTPRAWPGSPRVRHAEPPAVGGSAQGRPSPPRPRRRTRLPSGPPPSRRRRSGRRSSPRSSASPGWRRRRRPGSAGGAGRRQGRSRGCRARRPPLPAGGRARRRSSRPRCASARSAARESATPSRTASRSCPRARHSSPDSRRSR